MSMSTDPIVNLKLPLSGEQEDVLIVQLVQKIYISAHKDYVNSKGDLEAQIYTHPDDIVHAKQRRKAAKRILWYYMPTSDYQAFLDSVEQGTFYLFNPEPYYL